MATQTRDLLEKILKSPTAPFREDRVRAAIESELDAHGIPYVRDAGGNLIAGTNRPESLSKGFHIALLAHMDHPGFHLGEPLGRGLWRCYWYGGAPFEAMKGARVRLHDPAQPQKTAIGTIRKMEYVDEMEEGLPFIVDFGTKADGFSRESFGAFDLVPFRLKGDRVTSKAADDLVGCVIALGALIDQEKQMKKSRNRGARRLIGVFTRAEEVGFIGCLDLMRRGDLPRNVWCISLEASRALPEAEFGKGPVLRIGDKTCLFDAEFSAVLWNIAKDLQLESKGAFRFQRRILSGGTCEATPLTLFGHKVTAIAVPLLNYHNFGKTKPNAEAVSHSDVDQARRLCAELGRRIEKAPVWTEAKKRELMSDFKRLQPMLTSTKIRIDSGLKSTNGAPR
ncbi:MAG: hypothetical protein V4760_17000 [Bdellovibrionota bacterium]